VTLVARRATEVTDAAVRRRQPGWVTKASEISVVGDVLLLGAAGNSGQLFGAALVTDATGAQVTVGGQPA
jgi:hypothetical protein